MHISGGRLRRIVVGFTTIAAVVVAADGPIASGEEPAEVPVVSINPDWTFLISETFRDCDGTEYDVGTFGAIVLERTEIDGEVGELEVPVTYGGSLAGSLVDPQPSAAFDDPGWLETEIYVELPESTPGTLTITLDPPAVDAGYALGPDPEDTTIELTVPGEESLTDCADPIGVDEENTDQTITVGETPDPLGIFDFDVECEPEDECELVECDEDGCAESTSTTEVAREAREARETPDGIWDVYSTPVVGTLPPGLAYADDAWTGTATTPGVYTFDVRLCIDLDFDLESTLNSSDGRIARDRARARAIEDLPDTPCFGTEEVRVEVLAAAADTPSPPATPIRTQARFTG